MFVLIILWKETKRYAELFGHRFKIAVIATIMGISIPLPECTRERISYRQCDNPEQNGHPGTLVAE
jgi:hypothetical protein